MDGIANVAKQQDLVAELNNAMAPMNTNLRFGVESETSKKLQACYLTQKGKRITLLTTYKIT